MQLFDAAHTVRWGILGCGDVTEVKSGPALQKARGSALVAVMRRDRARAEDYARRHGVPRAYDEADALIGDAEVDAVYLATPPASHAELAVRVAAAGKPCLVEKPMARTHAECLAMIEAFERRGLPLFVAFYRRALPRFLRVRALLTGGEIGAPTSFELAHFEPLATAAQARAWRFDPAVAGGGLFFDLGSHGLDLLDFFFGPVVDVGGVAVNSGGRYDAEDVVTVALRCGSGVAGTGIWNFNADHRHDGIVVTGTEGVLRVPVFTDGDIVIVRGSREERVPFRNPPHVHQPFVQTVVDALTGRGVCESTGASGARTSWVMDQAVAAYYGGRR